MKMTDYLTYAKYMASSIQKESDYLLMEKEFNLPKALNTARPEDPPPPFRPTKATS